MKLRFSTAVCAAALLAFGVSMEVVPSPAAAQDYGGYQDDQSYGVDFETFHDQLAPYGDWVYSDRWGEVWIPEDVPDNFQPYGTDGYWADTDEYGWMWVSDYEWGDIPFHYGRWVNDPDDGWLWIPGYVWSPAWVIWRSNGQYVGWMPMPPDAQFLGYGGPSFGLSFGLGGLGIGIDFNNLGDYYGYSQWYGSDYDEDRFASNWIFVDAGHLDDRDFRRFRAPRRNYAMLIHNTRNITNYRVVNNYVVNRSVDPRFVQRAGGHPVVLIHAAQLVKHPQFIIRADQGRHVQDRMRVQMRRGTGLPGSAPAPTPDIVKSLSGKVPAHGGHAPAHLFTRDTITKSPLMNKPGGGFTAPNGPSGPGSHEHEHMGTPSGAAPFGGQGTGPSAPPSGENPTGTTEMHHHHEPAGTENPPLGPGGSTTPNGPTFTPSNNPPPSNPAGTTETHHHHEFGGGENPGMGTGQNTSPNGASSPPSTNPSSNPNSNPMGTEPTHHHHENEGGGYPGGNPGSEPGASSPNMTGPAGASGGMGEEKPRHEQTAPGGTSQSPSGSTGTQGSSPDDKHKHGDHGGAPPQ